MQTEGMRMEEILQANGNQKEAGTAILISKKIDFKIKTVTRDKEGHYIMIKGSIQEKDIMIEYCWSTKVHKANIINRYKRTN